MRRQATGAAMAVFVIGLAGAGCGLLPNSPSGDDVTLRGVVLGAGIGVRAQSDVHALSGTVLDAIVVALEGAPSLRTTVDGDGTFTLRGLPAGEFTVLFTLGGAVIGSQTFSEVAANQEITIAVELVAGEAVVIDEQRTGIGHEDVEIEGSVDAVLALNPNGESRFRIGGHMVLARSGVTAIREGNEARTVNDVTVGRRVHVKAADLERTTDVLAHEIKLQGPDQDDSSSAGGKLTICHVPPGNPDNRRTLTVGASAWPAHQAHGDTMGSCRPNAGGGNNGNNDNGNKGGNGGNGRKG